MSSEELELVKRVAAELPSHAPDPDRRAELRANLLARAREEQTRGAQRERRRLRTMLAVAATLAASFAMVAIAALSRQNGGRAKIFAHEGARHAQVSQNGDEIVRLFEGTLTIEVAPLHPGERFRIVTKDAEVEVRGTALDIEAAADLLSAVRVLHGKVEVRRDGDPTQVLEAGERWEAPRERPEEVAFRQAWEAFDGGDHAQAIAAFSRVEAIAPGSALAEDAAFWRAIAVAGSSDVERGVVALKAFLDNHPNYVRAGEIERYLHELQRR